MQPRSPSHSNKNSQSLGDLSQEEEFQCSPPNDNRWNEVK